MSRYQIQNTLWWLGEAGFDSIRQDTWPYVARDFWHDWMAAIKHQFPAVNVIGEVLDGDPGTVSFFQGGQTRDGVDTLLDTVFDYPVYFKLVDTFGKGRSLEEIPKMIGHDYLYPNPTLLWEFIADHDVPRLMNSPQATIESLKLAYICMFTIRGVPLLYYGDEIAMKGGDDPDNRRDFPGGWSDDPANAFTRQGRTAEQNDVFEHVNEIGPSAHEHACSGARFNAESRLAGSAMGFCEAAWRRYGNRGDEQRYKAVKLSSSASGAWSDSLCASTRIARSDSDADSKERRVGCFASG